MKKKNDYGTESLSFEDFEQVIAGHSDALIDELVREWLSAGREARQKER